ncbi:MAG TPA: hypothetical protein VG425_00640 [Casimicrobiaceae bacterium]|jgi:hypothetical protein|nr:hypothetical protein [Casimicrobiaceae bacterium]
MSKSLWILLFMVFVAPLASAEIFKCVAKDGTDLYQNFPCQFESMGWMSTNAPSTPPAPSDSSQTKAKAGLLAVEAAGKSPTLLTEPRVGMTTEEVTAIWGEPISSYQDELVDGRVEVWSYGASRSVQFDLRGRVAAVQR